MLFFTIGYGGRPPSQFVELLLRHGVKTVVDVRIEPRRACLGSYRLASSPDKGIRALLSRAGVGYKSVRELRNPFRHDSNGRANYSKLLREKGTALLKKLDGIPEPFCLMCAEKLVTHCHRQQLSELLVQRGHTVEHIEA